MYGILQLETVEGYAAGGRADETDEEETDDDENRQEDEAVLTRKLLMPMMTWVYDGNVAADSAKRMPLIFGMTIVNIRIMTTTKVTTMKAGYMSAPLTLEESSYARSR